MLQEKVLMVRQHRVGRKPNPPQKGETKQEISTTGRGGKRKGDRLRGTERGGGGNSNWRQGKKKSMGGTGWKTKKPSASKETYNENRGNNVSSKNDWY